jgi:predicted negative regulator of RcsB-dependent stress response
MRARTQKRIADREAKRESGRSAAVENPISRSKLSLWCAVLAVGTIAVYSPTMSHPFLNYDDDDYVTQNAHVQEGLTLHTIGWAFTSVEAENWHPLTWLSHALDCQLFDLNPQGHHLTSVLIHAANVVLLFLILLWATQATWASAAVAALFALHPLNVESVAWVAERKNVLSTFFFLLALLAYGRYVQKPGAGRYLAVAGLFAFSLMAKPMMVTLPFVLLLVDYWPLARVQGWTTPSPAFPVMQIPWPRLVLEKIPLLALSAASSVITVIAQRAGGAVQPLAFVTMNMRLKNAVYSYANYVVKMFWPINLAVIYPHPLGKLTAVEVALSAAFLIAVTVLVWQLRRRRPYAITGWLWYLGTLIPVIGIVQVGDQGMADRYAYVPAIGLFSALVWGVRDWALSREALADKLKPAAVVVVLALAGLTLRQLSFWRTPLELWMHTLQITEDNYVAHDHLAGLLLEQGQLDEANENFKQAAEEAQWDPVSHLALGASAQDRGDLQEAVRQYQVALQFQDSTLVAITYANLAIIFRQMGDNAAASQHSQQALRHNPDVFRLMIQQAKEIAESAPAPSNYVRLGLLLESAGQAPEARSAFERALQLDSGYAPAQQALHNMPLNP